MNTIENNKLISEFMAESIDEHGIPWFGIEHDQWNYEPWKFHISWDWLMPVIEKIKNLNDREEGLFGEYDSCIEEDGYDMYDTLFNELPITSDFNEVYSNVITFIQWYNKTK